MYDHCSEDMHSESDWISHDGAADLKHQSTQQHGTVLVSCDRIVASELGENIFYKCYPFLKPRLSTPMCAVPISGIVTTGSGCVPTKDQSKATAADVEVVCARQSCFLLLTVAFNTMQHPVCLQHHLQVAPTL